MRRAHAGAHSRARRVEPPAMMMMMMMMMMAPADARRAAALGRDARAALAEPRRARLVFQHLDGHRRVVRLEVHRLVLRIIIIRDRRARRGASRRTRRQGQIGALDDMRRGLAHHARDLRESLPLLGARLALEPSPHLNHNEDANGSRRRREERERERESERERARFTQSEDAGGGVGERKNRRSRSEHVEEVGFAHEVELGAVERLPDTTGERFARVARLRRKLSRQRSLSLSRVVFHSLSPIYVVPISSVCV